MSEILGQYKEIRLMQWTNTIMTIRNVFLYQGQLILIFTYSKATMRHNNSFYVVHAPCPTIQKTLFLYLAYIQPFRNFLTRQLEVVNQSTTNSHLFSLSSNTSSAFSASVCLTSLRQSTSTSPIELGTSLYRQIAISIAKKHLTRLIQPFDANIPSDPNGLVRLLF